MTPGVFWLSGEVDKGDAKMGGLSRSRGSLQADSSVLSWCYRLCLHSTS